MSPETRYLTHAEALRATLTGVISRWLRLLPAYVAGLVGINVLYFFLDAPFYPLYTALGLVLITAAVVIGGTLFVYLYTALAGGIMSRAERERRSAGGSPPN